eukprot:gene3294-3570_t
MLLVGLSQELLEAGEVDQATAFARQALQAQPGCRPAWLLLAKCFITQQQYAAALVVLNVVPTPPLPAAEVEVPHVVPPPAPKTTTQPQVRRLLAYLPGSILLEREPLGTGCFPDTSPNRITQNVLAAVYTLIQDIVSQTGWDAFLEIRSRVFLMQGTNTTNSPTPSRGRPNSGLNGPKGSPKSYYASKLHGDPAGRRLCVRWLDELIVALWHDLQAYMEWKVWDRSLQVAMGGTHAELVLDGVLADKASSSSHTVNDGGSLSPPVLTASDWMRRGALAERLGHVSDARAAYCAAVHLHFNLTCYTALLRLSAIAGSVGDVFVCATQILAWHQQRLEMAAGTSSANGGRGSQSVAVTGLPPKVVAWAVGLLASGRGTGHGAWRTSPTDMPPSLVSVFDAWLKWQSVVWQDA